MSQFFPFRHCWFVSSDFFQPPAGAMFFSPLPQCRPSPPPNSPASHFTVRFRPSVEKSSKHLAEHASLLGLVGRGNPLGGGTVIGVPRCRPQTARWVCGRFAGFWHAGTLAARPSQTDSPAAPDVRDHDGWAGLEAGSGHLRSNTQPASQQVCVDFHLASCSPGWPPNHKTPPHLSSSPHHL